MQTLTRLSLLPLFLASMATTASAQDPAGAIAARLGNRIEAEAVNAENGVGSGSAITVVEAPLERVLAVVTDYSKYAEFMPHFTRSRVLSQRGNGALVYMQASAFGDTVTLWVNLRIREHPQSGDTRVIEGVMTDGNVSAFRARWELTPIDGNKTIVRFQLLINPDLPFPSSVLTDENVRNARRVVAAVRERVR